MSISMGFPMRSCLSYLKRLVTAGFANTIFPSLLVNIIPSVANSNKAFNCRSSDSIDKYNRLMYITERVVMTTIIAGKRCCNITCHLEVFSLGKNDSMMINIRLTMPKSLVYKSSLMNIVRSIAAMSPPSRKPWAGFKYCNTTVETVSTEQNSTITNVLSLNILLSFAQSKPILVIKD